MIQDLNNALHAFEVRPQAAGLVSVTPDMLVIHTPLPISTMAEVTLRLKAAFQISSLDEYSDSDPRLKSLGSN